MSRDRGGDRVVIGWYCPGDSPLHRAPAASKLIVLGVGLALMAVFSSPLTVAAALAVVLAVGWLSVGWRAVLGQARPLIVVLSLVGAGQLVLAGGRAAVEVSGSLLVAVLAAGLVTLTTRTDDMLDALVGALRPARRVGVDPDRVALVLALVIRTVPVLSRVVGEVHQARVARGAQRSVRAFAVPLVIRTVRHADRLGEALIARGVDD